MIPASDRVLWDKGDNVVVGKPVPGLAWHSSWWGSENESLSHPSPASWRQYTARLVDITPLPWSAEPICQSFDVFGEFHKSDYQEVKEISPQARDKKDKTRYILDIKKAFSFFAY